MLQATQDAIFESAGVNPTAQTAHFFELHVRHDWQLEIGHYPQELPPVRGVNPEEQSRQIDELNGEQF